MSLSPPALDSRQSAVVICNQGVFILSPPALDSRQSMRLPIFRSSLFCPPQLWIQGKASGAYHGLADSVPPGFGFKAKQRARLPR